MDSIGKGPFNKGLSSHISEAKRSKTTDTTTSESSNERDNSFSDEKKYSVTEDRDIGTIHEAEVDPGLLKKEKEAIQKKRMILSELVAEAAQPKKENQVIQWTFESSFQHSSFKLVNRFTDYATRWERMKPSADAIRELLCAVYPNQGSEKEAVLQMLNNYFAFQGNQITLGELRDLVVRLEKSHPVISRATQRLLKQNCEIIWEQRASDPNLRNTAVNQSELSRFLSSKGIQANLGTKLGSGGFGTVYPAEVDEESYVLKIEKAPQPLTHPDLNNKFWRSGIAASRIRELTHFAKTELVILNIKKPNGDFAQWAVPIDKVKSFSEEDLPRESEVSIVATLMKRAPGDDLFTLMRYADRGFDIAEHFNYIAHGLFSFLEKTYQRNFVHGDIKPENIIYDRKSRYLWVIDPDLGKQLRKRDKEQHPPSHNDSNAMLPVNPSKTTERQGTIKYAATKVLQKQPYDSAVDFESTARVLKELDDLIEGREEGLVAEENLEEPIQTRVDKELARRGKEEAAEACCWGIFQMSERKRLIQLFQNVEDDIPGAFEALKNAMDAKRIVTLIP